LRVPFPLFVLLLEFLEAKDGPGDLAVERGFETEQELVGAEAVVVGAKG
jgi:hypothetical protein